MKTILWMVPALLAVVWLAGCSTLDKAYDKQVTTLPAVTKTNVVNVTNVVDIPASTNAAGVVTPPEVRQVVTPVYTITTLPAVTVTNLVEKPIVKTGTEIIGGIPAIPFGGTIALLAGWAYSAYAAFRNKKVSTALVQGIEAGRRILQETPEGQRLDARVKDELIQHQEVAGVLDEASKLVNRYTGDTVRPVIVPFPAPSTSSSSTSANPRI